MSGLSTGLVSGLGGGDLSGRPNGLDRPTDLDDFSSPRGPGCFRSPLQ